VSITYTPACKDKHTAYITLINAYIMYITYRQLLSNTGYVTNIVFVGLGYNGQ